MLDATTTCVLAPSSSICTTLYAESTSTDPSYANGFTYGEIVISFFLFVLVVIVAYSFLWFTTKGFKIRQ